jgi:hypothetical protein
VSPRRGDATFNVALVERVHMYGVKVAAHATGGVIGVEHGYDIHSRSTDDIDTDEQHALGARCSLAVQDIMGIDARGILLILPGMGPWARAS